VVYRSDSDEATTIKPTGERGRWERVVAALPPTSERIELRDAKGEVLSAVDIETDATRAAGDDGDRDIKLLRLLQSAQEMALVQQTAAVTGVLKQYEQLAKLLAERLTSLERGYSQVLSAAFESTVMAAEATAKMNQEAEKGESTSVVDAMAGELLAKLVNGNGKGSAAPQKKLDKAAAAPHAAPQKGA
jgi:hypothetical protein